MPSSRGLVAAAVVVCLAGCTNAPPPPLVTTEVPTTTPTRAPNPKEVTVGVDSVVGGYNPHKLSDQSTITSALAAVMLPSVFRTAPDGTPELDTALMVSAEVTSAEPYTVTYRLRPEAAWSDGAPIAVEDFLYLWERLREEPGVIDGVGYRLITKISAKEAGRVVEATFAKPYPGWRTLFSSLLPAHIVKDIPGGWTTALRENFPASGGPFTIKTLDRDRGEVILERNDRYWDPPATLDRIVLRRADQAGIAAALKAGHDQVALSALDSDGIGAIGALESAVTRETVARPTVVTVLLRPISPAMADTRVRTAVAAVIDRAALVKIGTNGGAAATMQANAQVLAPSVTGYAATGPGLAPDPARADALFTEAGYTRIAGVWTSPNVPLNLTVAAPAGHPTYIALAKEVQRQLTAAGVSSRLVTPDASELFTSLPVLAGAPEPIDLLVAPLPAGGDAATALATRFGCAPGPEEAPAPVAANPIGFCDPTVQPTIDAAVTGSVPVADALAQLEPALWSRGLTLPLYQEADDLVVRTDMSGVSAPAPLASPFRGAAVWRRAVK